MNDALDQVTVIVLAAGGGTRMRSKTPKVMHPISGRSMVAHVMSAVAELEPSAVVAVIGHQRELVGKHIESMHPRLQLAVQETQDGTAHAVRVAWDALTPENRGGVVLIAYGDTPLLEGSSLREFLAFHRSRGDAVSILSGTVADPTGYGRVIRNSADEVTAIIEEKDATPEEAAVCEINSGILAFNASFLDATLPRIKNNNAKGEYYLTDAIALARKDGRKVGAFPLADVLQTMGANDREQLAELAKEKNRRILRGWMRAGVTIVDPDTTLIDVDVKLAADVTILPGVQLYGATVVGEDAVIGPDSTLRDCEIGEHAEVTRTHGNLAVVGDGATVGPFTYLRPGTEIGAGGKVGGFVETKNATIGAGAKVPHLSYVGDAEIGEGTNIGAGTIFANFDGINKHRTVIGKHARTGSNNTFVAPVTIGDGAGTGAGTVVRDDVPAGALAVSAGPQRNIHDWAKTKRPGTAQATAAEAVRESGDVESQGSGN